MKLLTTQDGRGMMIHASGRLDAGGADELAKLLEDQLREGARSAHLDLSDVTYLSTPALRTFAQAYQDFSILRGEFRVARPSPQARELIVLAGLAERILLDQREEVGVMHRLRLSSASYRLGDITQDSWQVPGLTTTKFGDYAVTIRPGATTFSWRVIGRPADAATIGAAEAVVVTDRTAVIGVGAIGATTEDAAGRAGELLGLAGSAGYQPTDSRRADCLTTLGNRRPAVAMVSGLVMEGEYSHLLRFRTQPDAESTPLAEVAETAMAATGKRANVIAIVAESAGLVGCSLRQLPPPQDTAGPDFAAAREWFSFTPRRAFSGLTTIILGVVARDPPEPLAPWLRPLPGSDLSGHFHAAVFAYRPVPQRSVGLGPVVHRWFQDLDLRTVLHLIEDDRGTGGAGRNALFRGLCWVGSLGPPPGTTP